MNTFFDPNVVIPLAVIIGSLSMVAITLIVVLRDKISNVHVSRAGVEIRTNDVPVWSKVVDTIERIHANTCKAIRKGTTELMILDPELYDMSADVMLVIREANQPLIYAAYENHHTRELDADAGIYLADKAKDISIAIRVWKKHFPELSDEKCEEFACHWFRKVLLPNLKRACVEKVAYYTFQIGRNDVSTTVKEILRGCLSKNEGYIRCMNTLVAGTDFAVNSSIFYPVQTKSDSRRQTVAEREVNHD